MNRKERRKDEKLLQKKNKVVVVPFTTLCQDFATDYLEASLQPRFDVQTLHDEYNEKWKIQARAIIAANPKQYASSMNPAKTQMIRQNLIHGFERFAEKYIANPTMDEKDVNSKGEPDVL